jgi:RTX calcium-binding nonapeptide repeat (4 copies)
MTAGRACAAVVVLLGLLFPAGAQAAIPLQNAIGQPLDTREAGANTRFRFHLRLGGSEHIKDLTTQLPRGLIPNDAYPTCPLATFMADACPSATRTGRTTISVAALGLLPMDVPGRIYNLSVPGEALPGFGIVLDAPTGKAFQRGRTEISGGRLQVVINDFPQTVTLLGAPVPIRINSIDIELVAAFIRNPVTCDPTTTRFLVTSYEDPGTTSAAQDTFTPTGCQAPLPKCLGKRATKVGTGRRDVLNGTRGRDVIVGRGGNDLLRGRGGNDLLCGGPGRDTLIGGPGRDRLFGGPGVDKERQ